MKILIRSLVSLLILVSMNFLNLQTWAADTLNTAGPPAGVVVEELPDVSSGKSEITDTSRITVAFHSARAGNGGGDRGRTRGTNMVSQQVNPWIEFVLEARSRTDVTKGIFALERFVRTHILGKRPTNIPHAYPFSFVSFDYLSHDGGTWRYSLKFETAGLYVQTQAVAADPPLVQVDLNPNLEVTP